MTNISSVLKLDFGDMCSPGLPCCWTFPPPKFPKAEFEFPDPPTLFELNRLENELEFAPEAPALIEPNPLEKELEWEPQFELELNPFEPELPELLEINPLESEFAPDPPEIFELNLFEDDPSTLFELN